MACFLTVVLACVLFLSDLTYSRPGRSRQRAQDDPSQSPREDLTIAAQEASLSSYILSASFAGIEEQNFLENTPSAGDGAVSAALGASYDSTTKLEGRDDDGGIEQLNNGNNRVTSTVTLTISPTITQYVSAQSRLPHPPNGSPVNPGSPILNLTSDLPPPFKTGGQPPPPPIRSSNFSIVVPPLSPPIPPRSTFHPTRAPIATSTQSYNVGSLSESQLSPLKSPSVFSNSLATSDSASSTSSVLIPSPSASIIGCPADNDTVIEDFATGSEYQLQCAREFTGEDIYTLVEPTSLDCITECSSYNEALSDISCFGVTWKTTGNDLQCSLKSERGLASVRDDKAAQSAVLLTGVEDPIACRMSLMLYVGALLAGRAG